MAKDLNWDDSEFQQKMQVVEQVLIIKSKEGRREVSEHVLLLSQFEVPHDVGELQNSGSAQHDPDESIVGYHTPYAARLHEHPEYNFQKGRKGKYLEDPIKMNLGVFRDMYGATLQKGLAERL